MVMENKAFKNMRSGTPPPLNAGGQFGEGRGSQVAVVLVPGRAPVWKCVRAKLHCQC